MRSWCNAQTRKKSYASKPNLGGTLPEQIMINEITCILSDLPWMFCCWIVQNATPPPPAILTKFLENPGKANPKGPKIEKNQSRSKFSISLENFNPGLSAFPTENRVLVGGWLEIFNLAWRFQSRRAILNFFNLWALRERLNFTRQGKRIAFEVRPLQFLFDDMTSWRAKSEKLREGERCCGGHTRQESWGSGRGSVLSFCRLLGPARLGKSACS